jgi:hypothetical protein
VGHIHGVGGGDMMGVTTRDGKQREFAAVVDALLYYCWYCYDFYSGGGGVPASPQH